MSRAVTAARRRLSSAAQWRGGDRASRGGRHRSQRGGAVGLLAGLGYTGGVYMVCSIIKLYGEELRKIAPFIGTAALAAGSTLASTAGTSHYATFCFALVGVCMLFDIVVRYAPILPQSMDYVIGSILGVCKHIIWGILLQINNASAWALTWWDPIKAKEHFFSFTNTPLPENKPYTEILKENIRVLDEHGVLPNSAGPLTPATMEEAQQAGVLRPATPATPPISLFAPVRKTHPPTFRHWSNQG